VGRHHFLDVLGAGFLCPGDLDGALHAMSKRVKPRPWDCTRRNGHFFPVFKQGDRIIRGGVIARVVSREVFPFLSYRIRIKGSGVVTSYDGDWIEANYKKAPALVPRKSLTPTMVKSGRVMDRFTGSFMPFLRELGVSFKYGRAFWLLNEGELEYILHDFRIASKARRVEIHPDRGHSEEMAKQFNARCDAIERAFKRHGVGRY
jgi:hypothetical protein